MNRIISITFVTSIFSFLILLFSFKSSDEIDSVFNRYRIYPTETTISIESNKGTITINGMELTYHFDMKMIETILGKANRFITDTTTVYYEEFGLDGEPPVSFPTSIVNYYYIYDDLGLLFYTKGKQGNKHIMKSMGIQFENKRKFTNTATLKYLPKKTYSGKISLNKNEINPNLKIVPNHVNYKTKEFKLFGTNFGPTSIGEHIDRLYTIDSEVYMILYLNNATNQQLSFLELQ